jgi:hypothetical protein
VSVVPPATVTASLKFTVSVTTLPAGRSPVPAVMPAPDAATDVTVGVAVSICGPVWVTPVNEIMAASPKLFCTVAPLSEKPVAASEVVLSPAPTV